MTRRARVGCLGCLGRFVLILVAALAAGFVLIVAIDRVFYPWSFYFGGTTHVLPVWEGTARLHSSSGDYTLALWMAPSRGGRTFNFPYFRGRASMCTPRGERYSLWLRAAMFEHPGADTNGKEMKIEMYRRPWYAPWAGALDRRPQLTLRGRWRNPDFVANDGGTLSIAFLPDGRLYDGPAQRQPHARETLPVVLHEAPWSWFADCRAVK